MADTIYHDGAIHAPISTWPTRCPSCYAELARRTDEKVRLTCAGCGWTECYVNEPYGQRTGT